MTTFQQITMTAKIIIIIFYNLISPLFSWVLLNTRKHLLKHGSQCVLGLAFQDCTSPRWTLPGSTGPQAQSLGNRGLDWNIIIVTEILSRDSPRMWGGREEASTGWNTFPKSNTALKQVPCPHSSLFHDRSFWREILVPGGHTEDKGKTRPQPSPLWMCLGWCGLSVPSPMEADLFR